MKATAYIFMNVLARDGSFFISIRMNLLTKRYLLKKIRWKKIVVPKILTTCPIVLGREPDVIFPMPIYKLKQVLEVHDDRSTSL